MMGNTIFLLARFTLHEVARQTTDRDRRMERACTAVFF